MEKMVVDNDLFFSDVLQVLEQGRRVTIPVKGFSMLPFIRGTKDLVILEKAGEDLKADDIVLFHVGPADGGRGAGGSPEPDLQRSEQRPGRETGAELEEPDLRQKGRGIRRTGRR